MSLVQWKPALAAALLAGALSGACGAGGDENVQAAAESDLLTATFDKNDVTDDRTFTDFGTADAATIQRFLEKTPFRDVFLHTTSPLATYRDGGVLASDIFAAAARKYRINPIELLAAVEAEQSLVSATSLDEDAAKLAFRCGCPDGPECKVDPARYIGFTRQIECYGGALRAALDAQAMGNATTTGWKRGAPRLTEDQPTRIVVTPANTATAALYSYTPVVGKLGGGDASLGGVSKHWQLLRRFEKAFSYAGPSGADAGLPGADAGPSGADAGPLCATSAACSGDTPVCIVGRGTCGCTDDASCGAGRVCNVQTGPAGACVAGCRVAANKDSCGANARCDKTDGSIGSCQAPSCATSGCPSGLVCDTAQAAPVCVECTPANASACTANGAGSACIASRCGCAKDPDCGGAGRACNTVTHVCHAGAPSGGTTAPGDASTGASTPATPSTPPSGTGEPPSGHGAGDRDAGPRAEPTFAPLNPPPAGGGVGCQAASRSAPGNSAAGALGLGMLALVFVRRSRRACAPTRSSGRRSSASRG